MNTPPPEYENPAHRKLQLGDLACLAIDGEISIEYFTPDHGTINTPKEIKKAREESLRNEQLPRVDLVREGSEISEIMQGLCVGRMIRYDTMLKKGQYAEVLGIWSVDQLDEARLVAKIMKNLYEMK